VAEEPVDGGLDVGVAGFTLDAGDDGSVGIEDDGAGHDAAEAEAGEVVGGASGPDREVGCGRDVEAVEVGEDFRLVFGVVDGDGDEADVGFAVLSGPLLREGGEAGEFLLAGSAPGGPEIDDDNVAAEVGELLFRSAEVFEGEVGGAGGEGWREAREGEEECEGPGDRQSTEAHWVYSNPGLFTL